MEIILDNGDTVNQKEEVLGKGRKILKIYFQETIVQLVLMTRS